MRRAALVSVAALAALGAAPIARADEPAPDLTAAIEAALTGAPERHVAQAAVSRADAQVRAARAGVLGAVTLRGQADAGRHDFGVGDRDHRPHAVSLAYETTLFDGGARRSGVAAAKALRSAARAEDQATAAELAAEVAARWLALSTASGSVRRAEALVAAMTRHANDARLQFEAGEAPRSVVAQAEAHRARAEAGLAVARGGVDVARGELRRLTGLHVETAVAPAALPLVPPDIDAARALLAAHPAQRAADAAAEAAERAVAVADGLSGPRVSLALRTIRVRDEFLPGYRDDGVDARLQVVAPLWDGGARRAALATARADVQAARAQAERTRRALENGLRQAWIARDVARDGIRAAGAEVEAAGVARRSVEAEFRAGERPMVDLLDAEVALATAQETAAQARAAFTLSHWRIQAALGQHDAAAPSAGSQ